MFYSVMLLCKPPLKDEITPSEKIIEQRSIYTFEEMREDKVSCDKIKGARDLFFGGRLVMEKAV